MTAIMALDFALAGLIVLSLLVYLVFTLIYPENF